MTSVFREFFLFIRQERKWWMVPLLVVLGATGIVVVLSAVYPGLAPLLYPLV